jgi:pyrroloquinoline quinone biosynthesis protein D
VNVSGPVDSSKPRFAPGCRWGGSDAERVVLFPEGAIRVQGTGQRILELCDGERTFAELVAQLQEEYSPTDAARVQADVTTFLEQLRDKRVLDY